MRIEKAISEVMTTEDPRLAGVRQVAGDGDAAAFRFALVASRFNTDLTDALICAAVETLTAQGAAASHIDLFRVPGAFEIPTALEVCAASGKYDALIALGAVLEGDTPHAQAINGAVSRSLNELARQHQVPVIDGVVVARNRAQAEERCLSGADSRGAYAARAAVEMAQLIRKMKV
jgi:6,7-dimethyl-8-ribityllumazine synthase